MNDNSIDFNTKLKKISKDLVASFLKNNDSPRDNQIKENNDESNQSSKNFEQNYCATQNELNSDDADKILAQKPLCVAEVSNMGCTADAVNKFIAAGQLFAPGKAVNAGGVATSGLEMTQNSMRMGWTADEVDKHLHQIMSGIHEQCVKYGKEGQYINYVKGANVAGFMKVAKAMLAQGIV